MALLGIENEDIIKREFLEASKDLSILKFALFLQNNVSLLFNYYGNTLFTKFCRDCDFSLAHKIRLLQFVMNSVHHHSKVLREIYQFKSSRYSFETSRVDQPLTIDDFRFCFSQSENPLTLLQYLLLTCQIDYAFILTGLPQYRAIILEQARQLAAASSHCHCEMSHTVIIQLKLQNMDALDIALGEAAFVNDLQRVYLLLNQGADPLRAIAGAIARKDMSLVINLSKLYPFAFELMYPTLERLACAKLDEEFCVYLNFMREIGILINPIQDRLLHICLANGLVKAALRLTRVRVAINSLPHFQINSLYQNTQLGDGYFDSIVSNLQEAPIYHRETVFEISKLAQVYHQPDIVIAIQNWLYQVERYYSKIDELVLADNYLSETVELIDLYVIPYRLALRAAIRADKTDVLLTLLFIIRQSFADHHEDITVALDFCAYIACKHQKNGVLKLLGANGLTANQIACAAIVAGNTPIFATHFDRTAPIDEISLGRITFHLGRAGVGSFPMIREVLTNRDDAAERTLIQLASGGAVREGQFALLNRLLVHVRYDASKILFQFPQNELLKIITHFNSRRSVTAALRLAIASNYLQDFDKCRAQIVMLQRIMELFECNFQAALACADSGVRVWLLQGPAATPNLPLDVYYLICSYLIGHANGKEFRSDFYVKMHTLFLHLFLHHIYGKNRWEEREEDGCVYYQERIRGPKLKKARSTVEQYVPLEPYSSRLLKNLFFRPPNRTSGDSQETPLLHKGARF